MPCAKTLLCRLDQWLIEGKFTEEEALSLSYNMLSAGIDTVRKTVIVVSSTAWLSFYIDLQYCNLLAVRISQTSRDPGTSGSRDLISCGRQGTPFLGGPAKVSLGQELREGEYAFLQPD